MNQTLVYEHPDSGLPLTIVAHHHQRQNPLVQYIKECRCSFANIVPDYLLSPTNCVMFISLEFHRLHPDYLGKRLGQLGKQYRVRILLCLVDLEDPESSLQQITEIAFRDAMSLFLAWSYPEAAKILVQFKQWGEKSPDMIQTRLESSSKDRIIDVLTTIPSINKVDCTTLMKEFGTMKNLIMATKEDIRQCPGIGEKKLNQFWRVVHGPLGKPGQ